MSNARKAIVAIAVVAAIGGFIGFAAWNAQRGQAGQGAPRDAIPAELERAHTETIVSKITAKGAVELVDTVSVYSRTQAVIDKVHVKAGDEVKKGQRLLDYSDKALKTLRDQLADARLALRSAQISLAGAQIPPSEGEIMQAENAVRSADKAVADMRRQAGQADLGVEQAGLALEQLERARASAQEDCADMQALYDAGASTRRELDAALDGLSGAENQLAVARTQLDSALAQLESARAGILAAEESAALARAQRDDVANRLSDPKALNQIEALGVGVEQAEARVAQIQAQIDAYELHEEAPSDGAVLAVYAKEGDVGAQGRQLFDIADVSAGNLAVKVNVPESDARGLAVGQDAEIRGDAIGQTPYPGKVSRISPTAGKMQVGAAMETAVAVELSCEGAPLKAGYTVDATIITKTTEGAVLVPLMATMSGDGGEYFVFVARDDYSVEKRPVQLGEYSGIHVEARGVADGENVVISPSDRIAEGAFVRPVAAPGTGG
ncbi:MAG: efflux RND transporter periplasmic adaptor subunit [Clostridiales bacterium]|jgi:HlyD family secretion protein|nr:efflux RND transporter periplasmic adaptor subunit [Clostridiales bacterium]